MPWIRPLTLTVALVTMPAVGLAGDLTTRDVVELSRSGLGEEVLMALVEVDGGPFDLSPADLLDLKAEGLSDRVLAALVRAGRHHSVAEPQTHRFTEPQDHGEAYFRDAHVTHTVAVPVPVYVPVYMPRTSALRRHDRPFTRQAEPEFPTPGVRPAPVTADSIRHAPAGFHPGTVRSRTTTGSRAPARPASEAPSPPGIARSTSTPDRPPTPGVARSHRPPEP